MEILSELDGLVNAASALVHDAIKERAAKRMSEVEFKARLGSRCPYSETGTHYVLSAGVPAACEACGFVVQAAPKGR